MTRCASSFLLSYESMIVNKTTGCTRQTKPAILNRKVGSKYENRDASNAIGEKSVLSLQID